MPAFPRRTGRVSSVRHSVLYWHDTAWSVWDVISALNDEGILAVKVDSLAVSLSSRLCERSLLVLRSLGLAARCSNP